MINKVSNGLNKNFNFRANSKNNDRINYSYEQIKINSANSNKIEAISCVTGILAGLGAKIAQKDNNKAFGFGLATYFASNLALYSLAELKNEKESKEFYKKYMQDMKYENKFDEFISKNSIPMKIDFGNEEKNKTYFDLAHSDKKRSFKTLIASLGAGILSAGTMGAVCLIKGANNKLEKTYWTGLFTMLGTMVFNEIKNYPIRKKEFEEQKAIAQ